MQTSAAGLSARNARLLAANGVGTCERKCATRDLPAARWWVASRKGWWALGVGWGDREGDRYHMPPLMVGCGLREMETPHTAKHVVLALGRNCRSDFQACRKSFELNLALHHLRFYHRSPYMITLSREAQ